MEVSLFNVFIPLKNGEGLIYNTISKATVRLDSVDVQSYKNAEFSDPFYGSWLLLKRHQMIVKSAKDQYEKLRKSDFGAKKIDGRHMSLTLMLSEACNFSCTYCNQGQKKDSATMSQSTVDKVCSYIKENDKLESLDITWYGGEPLLSYNKIINYSSQVKALALKRGIDYKSSIITNGYLLSSERAQGLYDVGVQVAQVTLDGNKESHDLSRFANKSQSSYEIIISNIYETVAKTNLHVVLRVNVTQLNLGKLKLLLEDVASRGINLDKISIYFSAVYDPTLSDLDDANNVSDYLLSPNRNYALEELELLKYADSLGIKVALDIDEHEGDCLVTRSNSFAIDPNGNLFKCYIPISNVSFSVGSVNNFKAVSENQLYSSWDSWSAFDQPGCSNCKLLGSCRGGCPLHFVSESHKSLGSHCPSSKYAFNEHIFRKALMANLVVVDDWDANESPTRANSLTFEPIKN